MWNHFNITQSLRAHKPLQHLKQFSKCDKKLQQAEPEFSTIHKSLYSHGHSNQPFSLNCERELKSRFCRIQFKYVTVMNHETLWSFRCSVVFVRNYLKIIFKFRLPCNSQIKLFDSFRIISNKVTNNINWLLIIDATNLKSELSLTIKFYFQTFIILILVCFVY